MDQLAAVASLDKVMDEALVDKRIVGAVELFRDTSQDWTRAA